MRARKRNRDTEEYVAKKQARLIGLFGDEVDTGDQKLMKIIDRMDGDYFRPSLHPAGDRASSAWDNMLYSGPKSDLDRELIAQARAHYGLDKPTAPTAVVQAAPVVVEAPKPAPAVVVEGPMQGPEGPMQGPKPPPVQAEELKKEYVNEILGYDLDERIKEIDDIGNKGIIFTDMDAADEALLLASAAFASGGLGGLALGKSDEEEE